MTPTMIIILTWKADDDVIELIPISSAAFLPQQKFCPAKFSNAWRACTSLTWVALIWKKILILICKHDYIHVLYMYILSNNLLY